MTRMSRAAVIAAVALAGCGGDSGDGSDGASTEPPANAAELVALADAAMEKDDFDNALALLKRAGDYPAATERLPRYRMTAARTTLRLARQRLVQARRRKDSPRPGVSLSANSLRYYPTPEARAFNEKARRELLEFERKEGVTPDEELGGPPPQAGGP